jgi:hypothetical protein
MTADELALLGYQPGALNSGSAPLNQAASNVTPQELQQFQGMAGTPSQADPSFAMQPMTAQIDPSMLSAFAGTQPASDPDGLTTGSDPLAGTVPTAQPSAPAGDPANPATNPYTPGGPADQGNVQPPSAVQQPAPNQNIAQNLGFPKFQDWAKATGLPQQVSLSEREKVLEKYLAAQESFMARQDPEKQLKLQQMKHSIETEGLDDQLKQAQTAESQSKVVAGEVAKSQAQQTVTDQLAQLQTQKQNLDAVIAHPALPAMTGAAGQYNPGMTDDQRDLAARLDQLKGQGLINGINMIKTEAANPNGTLGMKIGQQEVMAVTNAAQRLQRYQSTASFKSSAQQLSDFLQKAIDAKQNQLASLPAPNTGLMQKNNYTPSSGSVSSSSSSSASAASVPMIKTIPGRGTFQSLGNGQWKQIQ